MRIHLSGNMDAGTVGAEVFVAPNATVLGDVTLGDRVGIWFGAVVRADKDRISIGPDSNVQDNCVVHTSDGHPVLIGREVSVGHGAILHGCTIGDRVLVGMGAIVLNGAEIGEDTLIGAGALVTEGARIPPGSVVIGIPGKVVKATTEEQRAHIRRNAGAYVELAGRYRDAS
ncbi:Protein YrdA [anaerobic digester metagenome]